MYVLLLLVLPDNLFHLFLLKLQLTELLKPLQHFILSFQSVWHWLYFLHKLVDCRET